jgi:Dolichyl-phosphate-mannose-protein mannosyltransferase
VTTPPTTALPWWQDRLLLGAAVVFGGWSLLSLTWPLSGDAGVFAWIADTVFRGGAPYVDAWDTKGPSAWLPSLLVEAIFGRTSWGIRVFDVAMVIAALAALRGIARRLGQPGDGRVAMALYMLWYASLDFWQSAQPDGWVASWLIVACWCALSGGPIGALAAGALVGVATLSKPFYLGYLVVLFIIVGTSRGRVARQRISHAVLIVAGVGLAASAILLMLRLWNGLDGYWEAQRWNRDVYAGLGDPWLTRIPAYFKGMLLMPWGIVGPIALFGMIRPTRAHRRTIAALTVGFLGAVAGAMLQGKGWMYHWLPMLPFLALLADIGFAALRQETAGEIAGRFRFLAMILAFTVAGLNPLQQFYRWARSRGSAESVATYERREFRYYGRQPESVYTIIDSLRRTAPTSPSILVWAMHPAPQIEAGLRIPSRFAVIRPLFDGAGSSFRANYRTEFEAELRDSPPQWWLLPTDALLAREDELRDHDIARYAAAAALVRAQYRLAGQTADWMIYARLAATPVARR